MNEVPDGLAARLAVAETKFPGIPFWLGRRHGRRLEWLAGTPGAGSDAAAPRLFELGAGLVLAVAGTDQATADALAAFFQTSANGGQDR